MSSTAGNKTEKKMAQEEIAKKVINVMEEQIETELQKFDRMDSDGLEELRKKRLESLKKEDKQKRAWLENGHGRFDEIDEREFFNVVKKSNIIVHFFLVGSERCDIVSSHLLVLAPKHLEVRFVNMNAAKCPFITSKLSITIIPTMLAIKEGDVVDRIQGFTELGNCDDFTTDMIEWRLAKSGVLLYEGDVRFPPDNQRKRRKVRLFKKIKGIREKSDSDSSD